MKVIRLTESDVKKLVGKILKEDEEWPGEHDSVNFSPLGDEILLDFEDALEEYGEYTYSDKGLSEILNVGDYMYTVNTSSGTISGFNRMNPEEVGEVLKYIMTNHPKGISLANQLLWNLDEREDFRDILDQDGRLEY